MTGSGTTKPRYRRAPRGQAAITWGMVWRALLWAACLIGFVWACGYALADRGYVACGGEFGILLIPLIVEAVVSVVCDE